MEVEPPAAKAVVCPELVVARQLFTLATPDAPGDKAALAAALRDEIFANSASVLQSFQICSQRFPDLAPLYAHCCERLGWPVDVAKMEAMSASNAASVASLDARRVALSIGQ